MLNWNDKLNIDHPAHRWPKPRNCPVLQLGRCPWRKSRHLRPARWTEAHPPEGIRNSAPKQTETDSCLTKVRQCYLNNTEKTNYRLFDKLNVNAMKTSCIRIVFFLLLLNLPNIKNFRFFVETLAFICPFWCHGDTLNNITMQYSLNNALYLQSCNYVW